MGMCVVHGAAWLPIIEGRHVLAARTWAQYLLARTRARKCARTRALLVKCSARSEYQHPDKASSTWLLLGCRRFPRLLPGRPKCHLPRPRQKLHEGGVATGAVVALPVRWRVRIQTEVPFVRRSMVAVMRRSFAVVINENVEGKRSLRVEAQRVSGCGYGEPTKRYGCIGVA